MTIVSCPKCGDEVTVPDGAVAEAIVRCPLCAEQYPLSDALTNAPPMLEIVSVGAAVASGADDEIKLATPAEPRKPFIFEEKPGPRKPTARSGAGRGRRAERNPLVEGLKIVAGGVVGLTIGQLILWWMPGNWGINNRDPAHLGRNYGHYVPWLVPSSIRDMGLAGQQSSGASENEQPETQRPVARSNAPSDTTPRRRQDNIPQSVEPTDILVGPGPSSPSSPSSSLPPDLDLELPLPPDPVAINADPNRPSSAPSSGGPLMQVSSDELKFALALAQQAWETSDPDERSRQLLTSLRELARAVTFAEESNIENQGVVEAARGLLKDIAADRSLLKELASAPPDSSGKQLPGHIVFGRVERVSLKGRVFAARVQPDSGSAMDVLSVTDPRQTLPEGVEALILGAYVDDPTQLPGYQGAKEPAVIGGLALTFPKPAATTDDATSSDTNNDDANNAANRDADKDADEASQSPANKPPAPPNNQESANGDAESPSGDASPDEARDTPRDEAPVPPSPSADAAP